MNGTLEACVNRLLQENIINPSNVKRKINNFIFDNKSNFGITLTLQTTGDNLQELITEICRNYNIGWNVYVKNKKM